MIACERVLSCPFEGCFFFADQLYDNLGWTKTLARLDMVSAACMLCVAVFLVAALKSQRRDVGDY